MRSGWKRENAAGHSWCIADWLALSFQSLWFRSGCATNEMKEENGAHTFLKCCRLIYEICCTFFFAHCRFTCRDGDKAIDPQEHRGLGGVGVGVLLIRGNVILVIEKWNSGEGMCKSWARQGPKCPLPDGQPKSQILKDYAKSQRKHSDKSDLWWLLTRDRELPVRIRGGHNTNQGPTTAVLPTNSASWWILNFFATFLNKKYWGLFLKMRQLLLTWGCYRVARAAKKPKSLGNHQCSLRVDGTNHTQPFAALTQDAEKWGLKQQVGLWTVNTEQEEWYTGWFI